MQCMKRNQKAFRKWSKRTLKGKYSWMKMNFAMYKVLRPFFMQLYALSQSNLSGLKLLRERVNKNEFQEYSYWWVALMGTGDGFLWICKFSIASVIDEWPQPFTWLPCASKRKNLAKLHIIKQNSIFPFFVYA